MASSEPAPASLDVGAEEAYKRISAAYTEMTQERYRPWVDVATRASFTPAEAAKLAAAADREAQRTRTGLSASTSQVFAASLKLFPDRWRVVSPRARNLAYRSGVPISNADLDWMERAAKIRRASPYGFSVVVLVVGGAFAAMDAGLYEIGRTSISLWGGFGVVVVVVALILPITLWSARREKARMNREKGTVADPVLTLEVLKRIRAGEDAKTLISEKGDPTGVTAVSEP